MKVFLLLPAVAVAMHATPQSDLNVNSRYTIESVAVDDAKRQAKLSHKIREDMHALVGQKLDFEILRDLAGRIRKELRLPSVKSSVARGTQPKHVKVTFETAAAGKAAELTVPMFLYHSNQGWSGALDAGFRVQGNVFRFGVVSDGNEDVERFAGVRASYERPELGTRYAGLRFDFESYHAQWHSSTLDALYAGAADHIYRSRQNFHPKVTVHPADGLTVEAGASFQRLQQQYPGGIHQQFPAARTQASNGAVTSLRYERDWETRGIDRHNLSAAYELRAATTILASDYVYTRHSTSASYRFQRGRQELTLEASGGVSNGEAPLFDRFVLGNASTLRGWTKYEIAPIGGNRMCHASVEYGYRPIVVFYDTGAIWFRGDEAKQRHSLGLGFRTHAVTLAVAFPIREGRATPVIFIGMNF
jgi:hypothetical protein